MQASDILSHVDHTLLDPCAVWPEIQQICKDGIRCKTASVCIPPAFVKQAAGAYGGQVAICTVIGFPLGYNTTACKVAEAQEALAEGADEVDMVVNLGWVKEGKFDIVTEEIRALKAAAGSRVLKVIVETCYLTEEEKVALCHCVTDAGADYIKTSTGFGSGGATLADVRLFKKHLGPKVKIKASGGMRTREDFEAFLAAGADRLGTSAAVRVLAGEESVSPAEDTLKIENTVTGKTISAEEAIESLPESQPPDMNLHNEIDKYIASQPESLQILLLNVRMAIRQVLPDATEKISWQMPTFWQGRNLIHFAAQKNHLGIYPGAEAMKHFAPRLTGYKTSKGAIQFPYKSFGAEQIKLITEIAAWCGKENAKTQPPSARKRSSGSV